MKTREEKLEAFISASALFMYYQQIGDEESREWWACELDKIHDNIGPEERAENEEVLKLLHKEAYETVLAWKKHGHWHYPEPAGAEGDANP